MVKKIFESEVLGRRGKNRKRRVRWLEDAENDRREMEVKNCLQKAVNGAEWAFVITGVRAHRGP